MERQTYVITYILTGKHTFMLNLIAYLPIASKGVELRKIDIYKLILILVFLKKLWYNKC